MPMRAFRVKVTQAPGGRGQAGVNIARSAWGVDRRPRALVLPIVTSERFSIAQAPKMVNHIPKTKTDPPQETIRASKLPRSSIIN